MPFKPTEFVQTSATPRFPQPDYDAVAEVARAWMPDDGTVGHLILQGDSLSFLTRVGPEKKAAYGARVAIEELLREAAERGADTRNTWNRARRVALFDAPEITALPTLTAQLREQWA